MRPAIAAALALVVASASAAADSRWDVVQETPPGVSSEIDVAIITNDTGHSLRVYRDGNGVVQAILTIRGGFDTLSDASCPTYQVDDQTPVSVGDDGAQCVLDAKRSRFALGSVEGSVIHSNALLELMNGTRLYFRYRMPSLGYRETAFSLKGSKQALNRAIGSGVEVVAE